jgi:hypothetical protein
MLFGILFFVCSFAFGQSATTSLRGTVKDPSGALVPNATVTMTDPSVDKTLTTTTNGEGAYQFPQIPPARYLITVTAQGLGTQSKSAELLVNQPATIDFKLSIQSNAVTVDVSASAQTLNTTDATLGDSVGNETIQALPMEGRDPISLLTLQPGVLYLGNPAENDTMDSRSGSVNGGRSDQGNITLDGMDDNDQINGTAFTGVLRSTLDSTEEFRVTTSNGNADTGRSSGAQVSLVTKSGTNTMHGALYEYYRPTNTVANQWFNKYTELYLGRPNEPQHYVQNTFGGAIGGPIKKDKLFYFFNYEGQRKAIDDIIDQIVPTQQFYSGQLGYQDSSGATHWLSSSDVAALDSGCSTNVPCGVNPYVQSYYGPLNQAGFYGILNTVGDGVNNAGYVFASPAPSTLNTSILKIDYSLTSKQQLFARGNLQKDTQAGDENLPGQPASSWHEDNTKGFTVGHTWTPTANIVNDARYAYIRQGYSTRGIGTGTGDWVDFRFLAQPTAQTRSLVVDVPLHNITDNLTLTRGKHTINLGGNWRGIWNNRGTDANSYSGASTNPYWLADGPNDPSTINPNYPQVGSGFENSYEIAYDTLVGTVPSTTQQYNYSVSSPTSGSLFPDGAFINRHFHANEFEYFVQDAWRIKPNLTVTLGVRHSILQAPYETHGQQISPTVDTHNWFMERGWAAAKGDVFEDTLSFAPSGKANGRPGYWAKQKANFAPRLAAVYAPNPKTSIRAGFGMYYDHFGEGIVNSFDQEGSFGLSNSVNSPAANYSIEDGPRFTGPHTIPALQGCPAPASTIQYPYTPPSINDGADIALNCGLAITWGIDNHLKTPYSYALDFSFQRELPGGFLFEENYVGRLGRHLLTQIDLAEPVNLVDNQGGGDYFTAAAKLSHLADLSGGNPNATVPTIQYFEDMFPFMAGVDYAGESATQAVYSDEWAPLRYTAGETSSLYDLDLYDDPNGPDFRFYQSQFSSLYAWSSIGNSSYHALQFTLRHPSSHGLTVDVSYTLSKSLDMGSTAERSNEFSVDSFGGSGIQNSWNPKLNKGPSDFDTRHLFTMDWVYALPVGRGKALLGNSNPIVDIFLGGWQFSGLSRWASSLPFSVFEPGWSTNWQLEGAGVVTSPVQIKKHIVNGVPQVFAGSTASTINNGVYSGSPIRLPYPGEAGERNNFRGDGYFDLDSALSKTWAIRERYKLKFAGEVYNVPNNVRFDASPLNLNGGLTSGTFGAYSGMLTTYRRMQFGLRLDF